jgi:hypothetical protein
MLCLRVQAPELVFRGCFALQRQGALAELDHLSGHEVLYLLVDTEKQR